MLLYLCSVLKMLSYRVLSFAIVAVLSASANAQNSKDVVIKQGPLRGFLHQSGGVFNFYDIPYATAPSGRDRFKAPLPPPTWTSVRDAVNRGIACPQNELDPMFNATITPDCLVANVHVPDTNATNLPVMVVVHGGGYALGFGAANTLNIFVRTQNIVTVTFNYRLGAYGFLCLGTPGAPGNAGMKDQVALLRWVRDNIASFGGNPNDVTIAGCSAGGSSVDLLTLSKAARGLFQKAEAGSASATALWAVQADPIANAKEVAKYNNFSNVDDINALEEFYQTASFETLINVPSNLQPNFYFVPCIEKNLGQEMFLDDAPVNIIQRKDYRQVPLLYGFADMEGLHIVNTDYERQKKAMNDNFAAVLPYDLKFDNDEEKQQVARRVKEFYFGNKPVGDDNILGFIDFFTDIMFAFPQLRSAKMQIEGGHNQIYLYEYSYTLFDAVLPPGVNATVRGSNHCFQAAVFYDNPLEGIITGFDAISAVVREIWSNFITTGAPVPPGSSQPAWPAANVARSPHMVLTLPLELRGPLLPARTQLWDDIYNKHYQLPSPPNPTAKPNSANTLTNMKIFVATALTVLIYF